MNNNNNNSDNSITISILNRPFQVKCGAKEAEELKHAASYLDDCARAIKCSGKVVDYERIIIMAALNICHEKLYLQQDMQNYSNETNHKIQNIVAKIDNVLSEDVELEH